MDPTQTWRCPVDHGALWADDEMLRCLSCGASYPRVGEAWDFRTVLHDAAAGWDAAAFDRAYRDAGVGFDGGIEHAVRTRIPRLAEEYREGCKGRRLEAFVREHRPARLLDLGCGNGWFCFRLAGLAPETRFSGIDVSPHCINLFLRRMADQRHAGRRMAAALACAEALPHADGEFDLVILQEALEHVRDPAQAMAEVARVLRPGGHALVTTPTQAMTRFWKATGWLPARLRRLWQGRPLSPPDGQVRDQPLSRREIRRLAERAGLRIVDWRHVIFLPHESYLQFLPGPLLKTMVTLAKAMEGLPGLGILALHHVIILQRLQPQDS